MVNFITLAIFAVLLFAFLINKAMKESKHLSSHKTVSTQTSIIGNPERALAKLREDLESFQCRLEIVECDKLEAIHTLRLSLSLIMPSTGKDALSKAVPTTVEPS